MSSTKKKNLKTDPMFDIDPVSGKLIPLPANWNAVAPGNSSTKKRAEKRARRAVELKPLHLYFGDFKEPEPKLKKNDTNSVRKGLFTIPSKSSQGGKNSSNKKTTAVRKNLIKTQTQMNKKLNTVELSPLMNLEEVEEEFLNKKASLRGYPFKSPSKPVITFTRNPLKFDTKPKKFVIPQMIVEEPTQSTSQLESEVAGDTKLEEPKTPESASSNEFLKLEQMCQDKEMRNICTDSPISSMCNLMSDTGLDSTKKPKPKKFPHKYSNVVTNIKNIIQSEEIAFNQYRIVHEGNMKKLYHILSSFEEPEGVLEPETPDKENNPNKNNRRSTRLQNKSPQGTNNDKLLVSPSILRSGDLRKSTLKKNLAARNEDLNNQSPRTRKAFDLYNTFREKHSILETPKLDRKALAESPGMGRYISMKVQNQCLLLQDTPIHK